MRLARLELDPAGAEPAIDRLLNAWPPGVLVRGATVVVVGDELPESELRVAAGTALRSYAEQDADEADVRREAARSRSIGGRIVLRSPDAPAPGPGLIDIVLERRDGVFGTGAHPTTLTLVEFLLGLEPRGSLVDVGCGTGVLAIAAALLGFSPVSGFDIDPAAAEVAQELAQRNGATCTFEARDAIRDGCPPADIVVANVPPAVHLAIAPNIAAGTVLVSGVLAAEAPPVVEAYGRLVVREHVTATGWYVGILR